MHPYLVIPRQTTTRAQVTSVKAPPVATTPVKPTDAAKAASAAVKPIVGRYTIR